MHNACDCRYSRTIVAGESCRCTSQSLFQPSCTVMSFGHRPEVSPRRIAGICSWPLGIVCLCYHLLLHILSDLDCCTSWINVLLWSPCKLWFCCSFCTCDIYFMSVHPSWGTFGGIWRLLYHFVYHDAAVVAGRADWSIDWYAYQHLKPRWNLVWKHGLLWSSSSLGWFSNKERSHL